jgi:ABC-type multidrug transport system ATPase subunit
MVRGLVREAVASGTSVLWTTQRIEEIRGFADEVTVLASGRVRFQGSVPELIGRATVTALLVELRADDTDADGLLARSAAALSGLASVEPFGGGTSHHFRIRPADGVVLGRAIAALQAAGIDVVASQNEHPEIETAFRALTEGLGE